MNPVVPTLHEMGYKPKVPKGVDTEEYRVYAANVLEVNGLYKQDYVNPTTTQDLLFLFRNIFDARPEYVDGLVTTQNAFGCVSLNDAGELRVFIDAGLERPKPQFEILKKTTLAHELGHALLHQDYILNNNKYRMVHVKDILDGKIKRAKCATPYDHFFDSYAKSLISNSDRPAMTLENFIEFQANQVMVGLLMPFPIVRSYVTKFMELEHIGYTLRYGDLTRDEMWINFTEELSSKLIAYMQQVFKISKAMATFELKRLLKIYGARVWNGCEIYPRKAS